MINYELNFTNPWLLFLLIPALAAAILPYFLVNKKYRCNRNRIVSMILHTTAMILAVFLLAGCTYSYDVPNKENELILLVDCSDSNSGANVQKDQFIETVINLSREDYKIGIVKFGYNQLYAAELSNDSEKVFDSYMKSSNPDTSATDVAAALEYASKLFKNPSTAKIVLIGDGIETDGSAMSVIKSIAAEGIKVDTAYYPNESGDEVQIVGVTLPDYKINLGSDFKITLNLKSNYGMTDINNLENYMAAITVYDNDEPVGSTIAMLQKGDNSVDIAHRFAEGDYGLHKLKFEITNPLDGSVKNNTFYTYIRVDNLNRILILERESGESQMLQALLAENDMQVTALGINTDLANIPKTAKELCRYDQVILVNIADKDLPAEFDEQLYKYVNNFGGGLFTVGGGNNDSEGDKLIPHAYNKDDLANTLLSEMLPVQAIDYTPPIAVMIVIDSSGSMSMGKFEQAQQGALACLDALQPRDFCGVMSFDTSASEEINVLPVSQKDRIQKAIREVGKGSEGGSGGTVFTEAIDIAGRALAALPVERRHIIMVTDGQPSDSMEEYGPKIDINKKSKITMSVVGINIAKGGPEDTKMTELCERADGNFYIVDDSNRNELPTIMYKDMELEAITGIKYGEPFQPELKDHTALFAGIKQEDVPTLSGYYGTRLKEQATAPIMGGSYFTEEGELDPLRGVYVPIYAQWKLGNGTVGSFMCDLEGQWSNEFMTDATGKKIIMNIIRSIFPSQAIKTDELDAVIRQDNYTVQVSVSSGIKDGDTDIVDVSIIPLTPEAIAFYNEPVPIAVADRFTRFTFDITCPGVYEIKIEKKDANGTVLASYSLDYAFAYSQEYNFFPERELIGEEFMAAIANDGRGIQVEFEIDIFNSFEKYIHRFIDPRIGMLIAVIVMFLLDVAVRKFKFKLPHEIIRDYRAKKAGQTKRR